MFLLDMENQSMGTGAVFCTVCGGACGRSSGSRTAFCSRGWSSRWTTCIRPGLLVCTTLFALFLGLAKRRHELVLLADDAGRHRKILDEYSIEMLDQMITIVTSSTLMAYSLYTFSSETARGHRLLMLTIPFVIYGIFRYLYIVQKKGGGGSPAAELLEDAPLVVNLVLWVLTSAAILVARYYGTG